MKVWLDGRLREEERACISPADHGFLLGDGVFETLRSYDGKPFALAEHLERLAAAAEMLAIPLPPLDELSRGSADVLEANAIPNARLRITVTSGAGPSGLARGAGPATVLITASPLRPWAEATTAVVLPWVHDESDPLAGVKTTSRAESVAALRRARSMGAEEALFLNRADNLCEATTANVFVVREGVVQTPPLSAGCLAGITRERVLRLCPELGIPSADDDIPGQALGGAEELFLTSSTREIQALVEVNGQRVGNGEPGPITTRLVQAFSNQIRSELEA